LFRSENIENSYCSTAIERLCEIKLDECTCFVERIELGIAEKYHANGEIVSLLELATLDTRTAIEDLIPSGIRSVQGIFFTEETLAIRLCDLFTSQISECFSFFDPACGAGNLIMEIAKIYPLGESLEDTLDLWGRKFGGCDLNESFVYVAKLRLLAMAAHRHGHTSINESDLEHFLSPFSNFKTCDYLKTSLGGNFDCVVANPPFANVLPADDLDWSSGKTQLAAIFMAHVLKLAKPNQKIAAILPDVLRSGTRYVRWREFFEKSTSDISIDIHGRFSTSADVDVFLCVANKLPEKVVESSSVRWVEDSMSSIGLPLLGDLFTVRVGPVVPHRLTGEGAQVNFLNAKNAPAFGIANEFTQINFKGTLYSPPFVLVRRTSSPSDRNRLVTTLVAEGKPMAIENHLLILLPKDGSLERCISLLDALKKDDIEVQINERIRCRHLTTKAVANLKIAGVGY
jgi:hypothetical protein